MKLEAIIWLTIIVAGLLAWDAISLWRLTGLSDELGMLTFLVVLAVAVIAVGGRIGLTIVRTTGQMYIHYLIRREKRR
jgi:hypothetical protein